MEQLLDAAAVAEIIGVSEATVTSWRSRNLGPKFVTVTPRTVRYRPEDVAEFLAARVQGGSQGEEEAA